MIISYIRRLGLVILILTTSFTLAFGAAVSSYLQIDGSKLYYGNVADNPSSVYVDTPTSEVFDYAVEQAAAYAASLSASELNSTVIRIVTGAGCAAAACITITRQEDGYKSRETIEYSSGLKGGDAGASYGRSGTSTGSGGGSKGPSPGAVAAYNSAVGELGQANSDLSSANAELGRAVTDVQNANGELSSAKSAAQTAESALNSAIGEYNRAAASAERQALATVAAQQKESDSRTQKNRLQKELEQKRMELERKKKALEASKQTLASGKAAAEGEVAKVGVKAVKPGDKIRTDSQTATTETVNSHNNAADGVTTSLDLEKSAKSIDTKKLLASIKTNQVPQHTGNLSNPFKNDSWCVFSGVGPRPTTDDPKRQHLGVDLSIPAGSPIYSPVSGVVSSVGYDKLGFGQRVELLTTINGQTHYVILAHMVKDSPNVKVGDIVNPGDLVGKVGNTGGKGRGELKPHLHLEMRQCNNIGTCTVKQDTYKNIVNPEPILSNAKRCPGK